MTSVGVIDNTLARRYSGVMKATLLVNERHELGDESFVDLKLWRVPAPVSGSKHHFKYSCAYVVGSECVLRYDNEAGKGDHKHVGPEEVAYQFSTIAQLLIDFWSDVDKWRPE